MVTLQIGMYHSVFEWVTNYTQNARKYSISALLFRVQEVKDRLYKGVIRSQQR